MNKLCPMPGCRVKQITPDDPGLLSITAQGTRPGSRCPECGHASRAVHSRYRRRPTDLPSLGRGVHLGLRVRRFYCRNAACARRTFAERLPELVAPYARRTRRLAEAQGRVGAALGAAEAASVARIERDAEAAAVAHLARRFTALVRACGVSGRAPARSPPPSWRAGSAMHARAGSTPS